MSNGKNPCKDCIWYDKWYMQCECSKEKRKDECLLQEQGIYEYYERARKKVKETFLY